MEKSVAEIVNKKNGVKIIELPLWDQLPNVDLYLDQMLTYIDDVLRRELGREAAEGQIITGTMVNNYVKKAFIKAPTKKRYDKLAVASLIVIAVLKSVFTMDEISKLITLAIDSNTPQESYDNFCRKLTKATACAANGYGMEPERDSADPRNICFAACFAFASQYFVQKTFLEK
ncbi:MAG: DUF1836 domain-containing protein [Peptostreptococcaceae bacterium]|nr:DUF1836 domain-containing protein [Peptostreptococcaceae bacterium]MDY5739826.1 DUF1836 domain-containing protein [Anaerovoracaceae bacterium]